MNKSPYSLADAQKICANYQHLVGQRFDLNHSSVIDCVLVAPFDQINKSRFIIYYLLFEDADLALTNEYKGLLFDVILIAGATEKVELMHEDLFTWVSKNNPAHLELQQVAIPLLRDHPQGAQ
jgi:hypothetical protein